MQGTVNGALAAGYTQEQAELIGKIDDLFEEAIRLDLVSDLDAVMFGKVFGQVCLQYKREKESAPSVV